MNLTVECTNYQKFAWDCAVIVRSQKNLQGEKNEK